MPLLTKTRKVSAIVGLAVVLGGYAVWGGGLVWSAALLLSVVLFWRVSVHGALEEAREESVRDEQFFFEIGEQLRRCKLTRDAIQVAVTRLGAYLEVPRVFFIELDFVRGQSSISPDHHDGVSSLAGEVPLSSYSVAVLCALREGRMYSKPDASVSEDLFALDLAPAGVQAFVAVPLMRGGQCVGAFVIGDEQPRDWQTRELVAAEVVAERAWFWVEYLRSLRAEERARELEQANQALLQLGQQMKASLREKEVLLKEIHHRVKNNLQVISSLLSLQAHYAADPGTKRIFSESQSRVRSIAMVHERLYHSREPSRIDFAEYLRALLKNISSALNAQGRGIALQIESELVQLGIEQAIPCGLLVNELVTNAFTHAFPAEHTGSIWIRLRRIEASWVELSVSDDGVGLPDELILERTDSLGLDLVYTLADQLQAKVQVQRSPGVAFCFQFRVEA